MPFSINNIVKFFSLSYVIFDRKYVLTSFEKLVSPHATVAGIVK